MKTSCHVPDHRTAPRLPDEVDRRLDEIVRRAEVGAERVATIAKQASSLVESGNKNRQRDLNCNTWGRPIDRLT